VLYNNRIKRFHNHAAAILAVCAAAVLAAGCTHKQTNERGGAQVENLPPETPSIIEEHYREDAALFSGLPADIRDYLLNLSAAFAAHNTAYLLDQGESEYERIVKGGVDDDEYLALLYRAGAYAEDAEWLSPFALDVSKISFIDYTAWRERGPVLEVDGIMYMDNGPPFLFSIMLLWRLGNPKILGIYP
jgi:hypothetical protein